MPGLLLMQCPLCKNPMQLRVELIGGCSGHYADDRCYCDSADVRVIYKCSNHASKRFWLNGGWVMNKKYCKQDDIVIPELSCQSSIERWLEKNYER